MIYKLKKLPIILFLLTIAHISSAQAYTEEVIINVEKGIRLFGTLTLPEHPAENYPVILIIAGSGPTDRDGNNPKMTNNSYKMLAEELANYGIASLRYDKRGIGKSEISDFKEDDIIFEDFINDACSCVKYLRSKNIFKRFIILGHSEGALIGMVAAKKTDADAYISVSGAGRPINEVILEQLKKQSPIIYEVAKPIVDSLKQNLKVKNIDPSLMGLFRPSIQNFLINLFKYNPAEIIRTLEIPVLIIQGDNDIQVNVEDAKILKRNNKSSKLVIIKNMNHVLKEVKTDNYFLQLKTYNDPELQLHPKLIKSIVKFIL
ncbi:MAG: alpha/beta hydrolase [Marinilabiliales bacterium]